MTDVMHDDAMSLAMFWAGVLMVFTPLVSAGVVIAIWRYTVRRGRNNNSTPGVVPHTPP